MSEASKGGSQGKRLGAEKVLPRKQAADRPAEHLTSSMRRGQSPPVSYFRVSRAKDRERSREGLVTLIPLTGWGPL